MQKTSPTEFSKEPNPFNQRPEKAANCDPEAAKIYEAVGRCLSQWELCESGFANVYATLIKPPSSYPAFRSFGAVLSARGRRSLIEEAADVFWNSFPGGSLQTSLKDLLNLYIDASARRNDVAHGITQHETDGYYWVANYHSHKNDIAQTSPYKYNSAQILVFASDFQSLGNRARFFRLDLEAHFFAAPEKLRARY
jgi:hypothetical protein